MRDTIIIIIIIKHANTVMLDLKYYEAQYIQHDTQFDKSIAGTSITAKYMYDMMAGFNESSV